MPQTYRRRDLRLRVTLVGEPAGPEPAPLLEATTEYLDLTALPPRSRGLRILDVTVQRLYLDAVLGSPLRLPLVTPAGLLLITVTGPDSDVPVGFDPLA